MDFKTMLQLPVLDTKTVINVLQEIADIERNEERPQMPQVSITTSSSSANGFFVNYDSDKHTILLCDMYDRKAQFQYIEVHSVASITVSNINKYSYLLSDGNIPFVPEDDEIPTVLQLKKDIKALEEEVKANLEKGFSIAFNYNGTPEAIDKFYASKVIKLLQKTLSNIAADNLAKTAFTDTITTVNFCLGLENKTVQEKEVITITIDTSKGLKSFPKEKQLQEQIEKGL